MAAPPGAKRMANYREEKAGNGEVSDAGGGRTKRCGIARGRETRGLARQRLASDSCRTDRSGNTPDPSSLLAISITASDFKTISNLYKKLFCSPGHKLY